jgi:lysozyme
METILIMDTYQRKPIRKKSKLKSILVGSLFLVSYPSGTASYPKKPNKIVEFKNYSFLPGMLKTKKEKLSIVIIKSFNFIKEWEGFSSRPYRCPAGHLTIGYGTLIKDTRKSISKSSAKKYAINHLYGLSDKIDKLVTRPLTQDQKISLLSFSYNIGVSSLQRSTLLKKINSESDVNEILLEFKRWNKIKDPITKKKRVLKGLSRRRAFEAKLWESNTVVSNSYGVETLNIR